MTTKMTSQSAVVSVIPRGKNTSRKITLLAFARFVARTPSEIEAIRILLNRPKGWSTEALNGAEGEAGGGSRSALR